MYSKQLSLRVKSQKFICCLKVDLQMLQFVLHFSPLWTEHSEKTKSNVAESLNQVCIMYESSKYSAISFSLEIKIVV